MQHVIIGIYDPNAEEYVRGVPYLYNGTSWEKILPKVYSSGAWKDIGGAGEFFYKFLEPDNDWYNEMLIRRRNYYRWLDNDEKVIYTTDNHITTGSPAHARFIFKHTEEQAALQDINSNNLLDSNSRQLYSLEEA